MLQAPDGEAALGVVNGRGVDVLVLDLHMPVRDGLSLLREMNPPPPVVIVYSAFEYVSPDQVLSEMGTKVFRELRKPVAPRTLIRTVAEAIATLESLD